MPGSKAGGIKASLTNRRIYGDDFYKNIGRIGGQKGRTGGFYANRELASIAGKKGGTISRRGPSRTEVTFPDKTVLESVETVTKKPHWRFW